MSALPSARGDARGTRDLVRMLDELKGCAMPTGRALFEEGSMDLIARTCIEKARHFGAGTQVMVHHEDLVQAITAALRESDARREATMQALVNRVSADLGDDVGAYLDQIEFNERESCARIADRHAAEWAGIESDAQYVAAEIRARVSAPAPDSADPGSTR